MKVSLNWLREYVELPEPVSALCKLLTLAGVEVEDSETKGVTAEKVVAACIESFEQHPNADRLSVCRVDDGSEVRQIVCGAKNFKAGDIVPLAQPGAVLPGNFQIKVGKLRGVESQGMLCAAKELGLSDAADGLLILPPQTPLGTSLREMFPADTILDVEVTPNRPDLLSHVGMAREIAALSKKSLRSPDIADFPAAGPAITVTLEASDACPFYLACRIDGVKVGPSPAWLQRKLESVGLRTINNIVDVTNYVMLELGQPLHAFDADHIFGGIVVRKAANAEMFLALDGATYELASDDLIIADEKAALALAGVMGGENSGTTNHTTSVILESAWFAPGLIRRTSRRLGLSTDSSYRFEREADPAGVQKAARRAAHLIADLAGGKVTGITQAGSSPREERVVELRDGRCREVAGGEIPDDTAANILHDLGLTRVAGGWRVPTYRPDLLREIDLIEEVIRVFGLENIPPRLSGRYVESSGADRLHDRGMAIRQKLASLGFHECRTVSLISKKESTENPLGLGELLLLKNPMSEDQTILRPDLLPGLLRVLAHNLRAGEKSLRLMEIGRVFRGENEEERLHLGLVQTGAANSPGWRERSPRAADFHDLKGVLQSLGLPALTFTAADPTRELPLAAEIRALGRVVGRIGQLAPGRAREMDATAPVLVAELDLGLLISQRARAAKYREVVKFPAVTRDVALLAPESVSHDVLEKAILSVKEPLLERLELFDVFVDPTGEKVPPGNRSLAYSLTYRATDRTLTADEVTQAHGKIKERLRGISGVTFRE